MTSRIDAAAMDRLFLSARTHNAWQDRDVPDALLRDLIDIMKMGPTSANCSPLRIIFVKSAEAKKRLAPLLLGANRDKTMAAPVCAILAYDLAFHEHLPKLFPHADAKSWFTGNDALIKETAFRNSSLQGAYFIMAARALGLDTGPMSGFNGEKLDAEFFPGGGMKTNFLCNLGYGDPAALFPRSPRFGFEEIATVI